MPSKSNSRRMAVFSLLAVSFYLLKTRDPFTTINISNCPGSYTAILRTDFYENYGTFELFTRKNTPPFSLRYIQHFGENYGGGYYNVNLNWSKDGSLLIFKDPDTPPYAWDFTAGKRISSDESAKVIKARGGIGPIILESGEIVVPGRIAYRSEVKELNALRGSDSINGEMLF